MAPPKTYDAACLGELVIDLAPVRGANGEPCLSPKPGVAPRG